MGETEILYEITSYLGGKKNEIFFTANYVEIWGGGGFNSIHSKLQDH